MAEIGIKAAEKRENMTQCYALGTLTVCLDGEIDHHAVRDIREQVDISINRHKPSKVIFDFENVTLMDSSGIGLIMGRYKTLGRYGGIIEIVRMPPYIEKVMKLSGVSKIVKGLDRAKAADKGEQDRKEQ